MGRPIAPYRGWAIACDGRRSSWFYYFTLSGTRSGAQAKFAAAYHPDKYPTWASLRRASPHFRAVKVTLTTPKEPV